MTAKLSVKLLGSFSLEYDGAPYRHGLIRSAAQLLAYLVLRSGQRVARPALAAVFWPDESDKDARANLRRHLHRIANALPERAEPWLDAGAEIEWRVRDDVSVDVAEFERLANDPEGLEEAVALYRGELLEEYYDDWVLVERERLRGLFLNACFELAARARRDRRFDDALRFVERILAADEWREDVVRLELALRYESGDRTGALAAFAEFAARLKAEMAVTPMPETVALRDAILANAPLPGSVKIVAERAIGARTPLVGRGEELESLDAAWSRAARGSGGTIFLGGSAGIGKSRLVGELAANAGLQGGRVLFGGTSNPEAFPYEAMVDALRSGLPLLLESPAPPEALARVASVLPELHAASSRAPAAGDPGVERALLFDAIARVIESLARTRPLLVVLEDLHWANAGTLEILEVLARRVGALPVLIVATYRTEEHDAQRLLATVRRALQRERRATSMVLGGLGPGDVDALARAALGDAYAPALAARAYELSEGNPLFANQLLQGYAERGDEPGETWVSSVGEAILARVKGLDGAARALADTAATIGRSFTLETAARVLGWDENETLDALGPLIDRGMVREAGGPSYGFTFTHALIANVIYESTAVERRAARHRRIAHVAQALGADDPAALAGIARHWELSGELERAAPLYRAAAERAAAVYAYDESLDWSARALALWSEPRHRAQTLLVREAIHGVRGAREEQRADLDELERLTAAESDDSMHWEVARRRAALAGIGGDLDAQAKLIAAMRERAAAADRAEWRGEVERMAASHAIARSETAQARTFALEALAQYERSSNRGGEVETLCLLAKVEADSGNLDRTRSYLERARNAADAADVTAVVAAANAASYAAHAHQDFVATLEFARTALELSEKVEDRYRQGNALTLVGIAQTRLGDFAAAREALRQSAAIFEAMGRRYGVAANVVNLGVVDWRVGLLDRAYENLSTALGIMREQPGGEVVPAVDLATLCARMGRLDDARSFANVALKLARQSGQVPHEASALLALGFADRLGGAPAAAVDYLERALALHRTVERSVDVSETLGNLALAYLEAGRLDDARRTARELAAGEAGFGASMWPQLHHWTLARVAHAAGDEPAAKRHLDAAVRAMETLRAQIAASEDDAPFTALAPNREIVRAKRENVWPD